MNRIKCFPISIPVLFLFALGCKDSTPTSPSAAHGSDQDNISVTEWLQDSQVTYDVGVRWMQAGDEAWIPDYPIPGSGGYPRWHVVLDSIDVSAAYHTASFSCFHDTWEGPGSNIYTCDFDPLSADSSHIWTHTIYINSNFELVATVDIDEGLSAYQSNEWEAAGCPNINYWDYQSVGGVPQVLVDVGWFDGKELVLFRSLQ